MTESIRTFVAIELPEEIKKNLMGVVEEFKELGVKASWTRPESLHLTLKFLGNTPVENVDPVKQVLNEAVEKFEPFRVSVKGLGGFPHESKVRVLWVGIGEGSEPVKQIAAEVEKSLIPFGVKEEKREYVPHLTLGRFRFPKKNREMENKINQETARSLGEWDVKKITFFKSTLHPKGAIYEVLHEAVL